MIAPPKAADVGIDEYIEDGMLVLTPHGPRLGRRVLFVNVSGGAAWWRQYQQRRLPSHQLWGSVELVRRGYEVAFTPALPDFYLYRNPLPHDLRLFRRCLAWLRPGDILYCAHNTLYWLPLLKRLGLMRRRIVSLLYAREPLDFAAAHDGIIAMTPAAEQQARRLAPRTRVARLGWGIDLEFAPTLPFSPEWLLSCGRTNRDFGTLRAAASLTRARIKLIAHGEPAAATWPPNVDVARVGARLDARLPYPELLHTWYGGCAASLVVLKPDPTQQTACGFTNLLESMAMSRPVILTQTNAIQTEIDIDATECGLSVAPNDAPALARAMDRLTAEPDLAQRLGENGRRLCASYYNMDRFGDDLHRFFETL